MKIKNIFLSASLAVLMAACTVEDFEENYTNPARLSETTVGKQFSGMLFVNRVWTLPAYRPYFVTYRITSNRYNQATGWVNEENQYVPGSAAVEDRWNGYYGFMAQYREMQKVYNALTDAEKQDLRIYMIAADTYFYDYTQQLVDLHGDIPWSQAGRLSINSGDYGSSYASYDNAEQIYTRMLDGLQAFADELNTIQVKDAILTEFRTQDLINRGDLELWKKYVNSLRLRMLTRVSGTGTFGSRADQEIGSILGNQASYPIVTTNADNILWKIFDPGTLLPATQFQSGLEDWNGNVASKKIVDHMLGNDDPRLTYVFEPGIENQDGTYMGLDPLLNSSEQTELIGTGTLTIYNRSTLSRNQFFPGVIFTATEAHLLASEYYAKKGQAMAKDHYEEAIRQSVDFFQELRSWSNNGISPAPAEITSDHVDAYLAKDMVSWDAASDKLKAIAYQKWLHFNVVQPTENWAEVRRLGLVDFNFWEDGSNQQSLPPLRWTIPSGEQSFNAQNYAQVQGKDQLTTPIFWDMN